jgi:hypothetical protein
VQVKGSGFVFGAYTHCAWPTANGTVADPTGKSFLFSLVNKTGKAARFSLHDKDRAIQLSDWVGFGAKQKDGKVTAYPNFVLMLKGAADQKDANAANPINSGKAYQPDDGQERDDTFLAGQH